MKKVLATVCMLTLVFSGAVMMNTPKKSAVANESESARPKLLRHVVLFKFKETLSQDKVREVADAFRALPDKIDAIHDFEWGTDVSVEKKSEGYTHCFVVTFKTEAARAEYLPHEAHQEFIRLVGPRLDKVLVVDYWSRD